jgi:DNA-binding CsgD family transcriptional regulator
MTRRPTPMQMRVLKLIAEGYTDRQAAELLDMAPNTARTHSHSLMRRMEAKTRGEAVAIGFREGWLEWQCEGSVKKLRAGHGL